MSWRSGCYCPIPVENPGDAPSNLRQFVRGFIGLQNHGASDRVEFGRITVQDLSGEAGAFSVKGKGPHVVEYRSTDSAGNVEPLQRSEFSIGELPLVGSGKPPHSCSIALQIGSTEEKTCSYVAADSFGDYDAQTTSTWSIRITRGRSSWLVAGHASAPSLPVDGAFSAVPGDRVTVTLGPDLTSSRDNNVVADGTVGTITVGDVDHR